ncbi:tudor domain-containing protein 5 isoform X3 [Tyto alba]|uniref:tudor domain-containing protein 5 isoform X3 n=1 Tax=Tyto alba TaxID=56313 RepID=UPI0014027B84|nr:tudor domain-containing protein 5 isoform X3 [Tyto alba]
MARADMSKQAQLMELLKKEVRSLLMAAKEGLTPAQLEEEYVTMIGKPLPLYDLGFQSTLELVAAMPEVVRICPYEKDIFILKAIADETTKGIAKLVARQKRNARAGKSAAAKAGAASPSKNPQGFRRSRAPVLPATVKAELQDLLSSSPLLLLDFDKAFFRRFGRAFQYTQYGFFSMFEVLRSVSDIITVEQTRAGSLLTLKKYMASEIEKEEVPQGEAQEGVLQAPPAVEMPPLEPCYEKDCFHLTEEEKAEPVETQAVNLGGGLKQLQDLEQFLLEKMIMTPEIPPDAVQDRSLCSLPPLGRRYLVGVFVEFVVSPSQFYIHVCSKETSDKLLDMMIEMRHCYSNKIVSDRYIMPESSVQPGQLCCVMSGKWWYRVIIHRVINDQEVEVFYTDYGNLEIVRKYWLRFLKWSYLKLPAQAIPCSLARVKPVEGTWSNAATLLFKKLCGSKLLVGIVDEYVNGILHLFLCDTSTKEDVYFHCVLRDGGCADVCTENVPSQEHLPAKKETWDDAWPLLDEVSVPSTTDQGPELVQENTNETPAELMAVAKCSGSGNDNAETPHSPGESSMPAVLLKPVEDTYTSFIDSKQPAEMSQDDPDQMERFSNKAQLGEAVHPSVLLMAIPFMLDHRNNEEKMKNKDLPGSLAVGLCSASGLSDQRPSQKLYVPRTTLSAVLAAARLAASSDYFQWLPSVRKKV